MLRPAYRGTGEGEAFGIENLVKRSALSLECFAPTLHDLRAQQTMKISSPYSPLLSEVKEKAPY
jgi:hypothetical protein